MIWEDWARPGIRLAYAENSPRIFPTRLAYAQPATGLVGALNKALSSLNRPTFPERFPERSGYRFAGRDEHEQCRSIQRSQ